MVCWETAPKTLARHVGGEPHHPPGLEPRPFGVGAGRADSAAAEPAGQRDELRLLAPHHVGDAVGVGGGQARHQADLAPSKGTGMVAAAISSGPAGQGR
jgi:hypothetical protein